LLEEERVANTGSRGQCCLVKDLKEMTGTKKKGTTCEVSKNLTGLKI